MLVRIRKNVWSRSKAVWVKCGLHWVDVRKHII